MDSRNMFRLSLLLKAVSSIVAIPYIVFGLLVGVVGHGPDGVVDSTPLRFLGFVVLVLGILYVLPNSKVYAKKKVPEYIATTLAPGGLLTLYLIVILIKEGYGSFTHQGGTGRMLVIIVLSLLPSVSLILYSKAKEKESNSTL